MLVAKAKLEILCAHAVFCKLFTQIARLLVAHILDAKSVPKTLPKRRPNVHKNNSEDNAFFYIDCLAHWDPFWGRLGPHVGAKLAQIGLPQLILACVDANWCWRHVLGMVSGGTREDFGGDGDGFGLDCGGPK